MRKKTDFKNLKVGDRFGLQPEGFVLIKKTNHQCIPSQQYGEPKTMLLRPDVTVYPFKTIGEMMAEDNTYNGHPNWETWNVLLWAFNDEYVYRRINEYTSKYSFDSEGAEDFVREMWPYGTPDMDGDPKDYDTVDWDHVAEGFNEV